MIIITSKFATASEQYVDWGKTRRNVRVAANMLKPHQLVIYIYNYIYIWVWIKIEYLNDIQ